MPRSLTKFYNVSTMSKSPTSKPNFVFGSPMESAVAQKLAPAAEPTHELGPLDELIPVTLILPRDTYLWLREAAYHHKGFVMQEHVNEAVRAHLTQLGPREPLPASQLAKELHKNVKLRKNLIKKK